jgi:hypothetical protein
MSFLDNEVSILPAIIPITPLSHPPSVIRSANLLKNALSVREMATGSILRAVPLSRVLTFPFTVVHIGQWTFR